MRSWILLLTLVCLAAVTSAADDADFDIDNFLMTEMDVDQVYDDHYDSDDSVDYDSDGSDDYDSDDSDDSYSDDSDDSEGRHRPRPRPCCSPDQMECHVSVMQATKTAKSRTPTMTGVYMPRLAVDFRRGIMALKEMIFQGKKVTNLTTIVNFKQSVGYAISWKDKRCVKFRVPKAMADHCIPKTARHAGTIWLGAGRHALVCDRWFVKAEPKPGVKVMAVSLVQRDGCVAIGGMSHVSYNGTTTVSTVHYYDVMLRIRDWSMFKVPTFCDKMPVLDLPQLSDTASGIMNHLVA